MTIKYYTHQNPPQIMGETFTEPSLTRESDYVSLENLFERFCLEGKQAQMFIGASQMSAEEKEQLLAETDVADLEEMDLVEQKAFADDVLNRVIAEQERKEKPTQSQTEPEQPKAEEQKEPKNA